MAHQRSQRVLGRFASGILAFSIVLVLTAGPVLAKEYVIGLSNDRSGPTASVGVYKGEGWHDYIKLFNSKNLLGAGNSINGMEIDHGYNVPRGLEVYGRLKEAGALIISENSTPISIATSPRLPDDKIIGITVGFGAGINGNGKRFPWLFPVSASYFSQSAGAVKWIMDHKKKARPKVAFLFLDNPAGREPLDVLHELRDKLGFDMQEFSVPPPGIEMRPQVLDITRKYKADWVIAQLFGRAVPVHLKEFIRAGYPRDHVVGLVWAGGENDYKVAGYKESAGHLSTKVWLPGENAIRDEIRALYKAEGKEPNPAMDQSNFYNSGLAIAGVMTEAVRRAVEKKGTDINSEDVRQAMETLTDFSLGGLMAPLTITPEDHEGGGGVAIMAFQADGTYKNMSGFIKPYRDVVWKNISQQ